MRPEFPAKCIHEASEQSLNQSLKGKIKSPKSFVEEKSEEVTKSRAEKPDSLTVPLRLSLRLCFTSQWDLTATQ